MRGQNDNIYPFIIYADDDPDDLAFVRETFRKINPNLVVYEFTNGLEAFKFLEAIPEDGILPCLIILDLNMPYWNGIQTLKTIKEKSNYHCIPVCILTNSDHPQHRAASYSAGAANFVTKPYSQAELTSVCLTFISYTTGIPQLKKN